MRDGSNNSPKNQDNRRDQAEATNFQGAWVTKLKLGDSFKVGEATVFIKQIHINYVTVGVIADRSVKISRNKE